MKRLIFVLLTFYVISNVSANNGVSNSKSLPTIASQPVTQLIHNTSVTSAVFNIEIASSEPITYQWYKNGLAIAGATNSSYTATGLTLADTSSGFRVIATNTNGSTVSKDAFVKFISSHPSDEVVAVRNDTSMFKNANIDLHNSKASVYPNPITGNFFTLTLTNTIAGNYTLNVLSSNGAFVFKQLINHTGGTASQKVVMNHSLAAGIYYLTITSRSGSVNTVKLIAG